MSDQSTSSNKQPDQSPAHSAAAYASSAQWVMRRYTRIETENGVQAEHSSHPNTDQTGGNAPSPFATEAQLPTRDALFDLYNRHRPD